MFDIAALQSLGYLGVFFSGFLSTFTLFIPSPTFVVVFLLGGTLNPVLLGIIGGLGAAVGEMIGYGIGYGVSYSNKIRKSRWYRPAKKLFEKYDAWILILIFSAAPVFPFDLVGLFCGTIRYNKKLFFILTLIGKILKYIILAYAGYLGIAWVLSLF